MIQPRRLGFCRGIAFWFVLLFQVKVNACPFCSAVSQTFSEEMSTMKIVAIAKLVDAPPIPPATEGSQELSKATFALDRFLKGKDLVSGDEKIQVIYFGKAEPGTRFFLMAAETMPETIWSTPLQVSELAEQYLMELPNLPADHQRLEFFQKYLEDKDELLARDAYDEFAKTPYAGIIALKDKLDRAQLIGWIEDPAVPASRRRLYLTLLGVCGQAEDAQILEKFLRSENRDDKRGLDALIACYLTLNPDGMSTVEELYLANKKADYADTYAAIMALRFHGTELTKIPRPRLLIGLRHMLSRPELADLVIPDLARWEDWTVLPDLVQLFKDATEETIWVRVPVINYLRACPQPEAAAAIEELTKIDPDAVKRASAFFAFGASNFGGKTATEAPVPPAALPAPVAP